MHYQFKKFKKITPYFLLTFPLLVTFFIDSCAITKSYIITEKIGIYGENLYLTKFVQNDYMDEIIQNKGFINDTQFATWANKKYFHNESIVVVPNEQVSGCLSFNFSSPNQKHMYARNFDFGQALPTIVTLTKPTKGYMYFSNTSYTVYTDKPTTTDPLLIQKLASVSTYVPLDGMNEKGLVVSMNNVNYYSGSLLVNQHYPNRVNLTMTLLFKYLLENAGTVEEAQEIINNVNIHDDLQTSGMSQHLQIADNLGNSAIVEFANDSNNTTQYVYPRTNESFLVNENFPEFGIDDWSQYDNTEGKYNRYASVHNALVNNNGVLENGFVQLQSNQIGSASTWSVIYNLTDLTMEYVWSGNFERKYSFSFCGI